MDLWGRLPAALLQIYGICAILRHGEPFVYNLIHLQLVTLGSKYA